ncbi:MAG: 4-hydroxy-tetrahydrodipicolinate reductase [Bacteroidota bacterium]
MKIAIIGYGRMGKTIEKLAPEYQSSIHLAIDTEAEAEQYADQLKEADVAIEFSQPEVAFDNIVRCLNWGIPVVSGTTGWLDRMEEVRAICEQQKGAFFYASNFSIGVNIFFAVNRYLAQMMDQYPQYQIDLEEIHHTGKVDAPSGTAISLAKDILAAVERKANWVKEKEEKAEDLAIRSVREAHVPGTHEVFYSSPIDQLSIKHIAHSREGFARGALQAAKWLVGKQGCFGMRDLLGI